MPPKGACKTKLVADTEDNNSAETLPCFIRTWKIFKKYIQSNV